MTSGGERPYVEPQSLTDTDLHVYEAIATLEQDGHPPTRREIATAAQLDDGTVAGILHKLADRRVVTVSGEGDDPGYALTRHDWSSAPDRPQG